jgi:predicted patatin/cPLA2 family phospholipase
MATYKGYFKPKNQNKYRGDPTNIIYRSRWELIFMQYLDSHSAVQQWSSEELAIPYRSPIDGKVHRYYPDFWVKKTNREGKTDIVLVEIKPLKETKQPTAQKKITKRYLYEVKTWGINSSKWKAAENYCMERGWKFLIITERELGLKF